MGGGGAATVFCRGVEGVGEGGERGQNQKKPMPQNVHSTVVPFIEIMKEDI